MTSLPFKESKNYENKRELFIGEFPEKEVFLTRHKNTPIAVLQSENYIRNVCQNRDSSRLILISQLGLQNQFPLLLLLVLSPKRTESIRGRANFSISYLWILQNQYKLEFDFHNLS